MMSFVALDHILAPQMFGGMIRQTLGHALRDVNMATYKNLFEPEPRPELGARYRDPPPPLILEAPSPAGGLVRDGEEFRLVFSLVGDSAVLSNRLVEGIEQMGALGLGKTRGQMELTSIVCIMRDDEFLGSADVTAPPVKPNIPEMPDAARVVLSSPLRQRNSGEILTHQSFTARLWIQAIQNRISVLDAAYGEATLNAPKIDVPECPIYDVQLWFVDQQLWSSRGGKRRDVGGLMGNFLLPLTGLELHWPAIWAGQWYQVGAGVNAGLGSYRILPE